MNALGQTLLHIAAEYGNEYLISYIAEKSNINLDICDLWDRTPLELAIKRNNVNSVILLAVLGSDINLKRDSRDTPFEQALFTNEYKLILNLIALGGKITPEVKKRILSRRINSKIRKLLVLFN